MSEQNQIALIETSLPVFQNDKLILSAIKEKHNLEDRMAHYNIPGVSAAVFDNNDLRWAKGYGVLKANELIKVDANSIFQACSTSKMVSTLIVLYYVEQGLLDLDKDVNEYLASWKVPENEFTSNKKVTVKRLLSHQAGINRPDGGYEWKSGSEPTLVQILNGEAPAEVQSAKVEYLPESKWQYANNGFLIIQLVLEDITGKSFADLAQEIIFTPLGMKNSTFKYPLSEEWAKREIMLHDDEGNPTHHGMIPSALAHGGLMTTPTDLAIFGIELCKAFHGESDQLISQKMAQLMFNQAVWVEDKNVFGFPFSHGLGSFMVGEGNSQIVFHPGANDPGASCMLCFNPKTKQGTVVMTNGMNGYFLTNEILTAIAHVYRWPKLV